MIWVTSTNSFAIQFTNIAGDLLEWPQPLQLESSQLQSSQLHSRQADLTQMAFQKNEMKQAEQTKKVLQDKQARQTTQTSPATQVTQNIQPNNKIQLEFHPQAIVILGSGLRKGVIDLTECEYQNLSPQSMERIRAGMRLAKESNLPILVTGGAPDRIGDNDLSEAQLMKKVLEREFGITPEWVEEQSNTTQENAAESAKILKNEGITTIYIVTHFWHMPRAKRAFKKQGLIAIQAPMGFYQKEQFTSLDFYPSSEGFQRTRWIWHTLLGTIWYKLRY